MRATFLDFTELVALLNGPQIATVSFILMLVGLLALAVVNLIVEAPRRDRCQRHNWCIDRFGLYCDKCKARPQEDTEDTEI
jgi:hypothetical protein